MDQYRTERGVLTRSASDSTNRHVAVCPDCNGLGWVSANVPIGDPSFGKLIPCACTTSERSARLQRLSGLTPDERLERLSHITSTGGQTDIMASAAQSFVLNPRGFLTVYGGSGNAKSLMLRAVVNECLDRQIEAVYVLMKDLIDYVREAIRDDDSAVARVDRFKRVRVLAIDEFDKIKSSDWVRELETDVIDRRYRAGLAGLSGTVIAMNESPRDLPEHIFSRLSDGRNVLINNTDADLRSLMA
jgi:DNA replication protein DnaC